MTKEEKKIYDKEYREKNKERINDRRRIYEQENKDLVRARQRAWYKKDRERNPEKYRAREKKDYEKNKTKRNAKRKRWYMKNKEHRKAWDKAWSEKNKLIKLKCWLKCAYGITLAEYQKLVDRFNGCCYVCGSNKRMCVDHCHISGRVRGYLCNGCNSALGYAKDSPDRLRALAKYLEDFGMKQESSTQRKCRECTDGILQPSEPEQGYENLTCNHCGSFWIGPAIQDDLPEELREHFSKASREALEASLAKEASEDEADAQAAEEALAEQGERPAEDLDRYKLEDLVKQIKPENRHDAVEDGPSVGNEAW